MEAVRTTLTSYLSDFSSRGDETAYARRRGLRLVRWSYARVARTAFQFARELEARGVARGDRVILWAADGPEWVAAFFGCLARGAIVVPLDVQSESGFASRVEAQVEPKLVVLDRVTRGRGAIGAPVLDLGESAEILSRHSIEPVSAADVARDETCEIVFTSGTTAEPKGVVITHWNLLVNLIPLEQEIKRYLKWERFVHPVRFLNLLPLSHVFGQIMGIFAPQLLGGEVFFQESLGPSQIIETIKRERISVLIAVPRMLEALREKIERDFEARGALEDFRRRVAAARGRHPLRRWWEFRAVHFKFGLKFWAFISGGATLPSDAEEFWDRLGFAVIQGYGMTETASLVTVNHPFKLARGSIGQVMPGQEVKLASDGEILVRGENVTKGYWRGAPIADGPDDGWFHTGDLGALDEKGNLYFKGRKKGVIVTAAGMKVFPEDLEQVLDHQPEIKASAVIPVEGAAGPEPLAVLVLRHPEADVKSVIDRANRSLAEHQRVRRWLVWPDEDFPRTSTLKIRKAAVAERVRAASDGAARPGHAQAIPAASGGVEEIVSRMGAGARGAVDPSAKLGADLKLDSLGRVELLSAIEDRYQVEIDEAAFTEETTIGEVERIIREGASEEAAPYPYPRWQERWPIRWLRIAMLYILVIPVTRLLGRPRITGREALGDLGGPAVFVANHVAIVDHALVLLALPGRLRRKLAIAMDGEILRERIHPSPGTGVFRRVLYVLEYVLLVFFFNVFSMPRKSGFRKSFAFAGEMMDRGYSILVFPEGRLTQDGRMGPFMPGTGLLVSELHAPVVPIRLDGLWGLKVAGRRRARPGEISISVGEAARYDEGIEPERIAVDLEARVARLSSAAETEPAAPR